MGGWGEKGSGCHSSLPGRERFVFTQSSSDFVSPTCPSVSLYYDVSALPLHQSVFTMTCQPYLSSQSVFTMTCQPYLSISQSLLWRVSPTCPSVSLYYDVSALPLHQSVFTMTCQPYLSISQSLLWRVSPTSPVSLYYDVPLHQSVFTMTCQPYLPNS